MIFALGAFDGFHLGHQRLLETARERAIKSGREWGVITFDGHPQLLFNKDSFKLLFSPEEREILIRYFDIPAVDKILFNIKLADMFPADFLITFPKGPNRRACRRRKLPVWKSQMVR